MRRKAILLGVTVTGLAAGGGAHLAGAPAASRTLWAFTTVAGLAPVAVTVVRDLRRRHAGVDIVAVLAMAGALGLGEVLAGAVIAVMASTGTALEEAAGARARRELRALIEHAPRAVHRYAGGVLTSPGLDEVRPGDLLLVKPGEVVPVDGTVAGAVAVLDESTLTGEARPVERGDAEAVRSGAVNAGAPFDMRATTTAEGGTYAGIVRLVREAQASKAPLARLADRYALAFVPATLAIAGAAWAVSGDPVRALAVLVVATPCPLILAVPVALVSGISRAARRGVVVKGGAALEGLGRARVLLFDKTGTLTAGRPRVTEVVAPEGGDPDALLGLAASLDQVSAHVLAAAVVHAATERGLTLGLPTEVCEEPGRGVRGRVDGHRVAIGRADWVDGGRPPPGWVRLLRRRTAFEGQATAFVAVDGTLRGALVLEDRIRADTPRTLRALRREGITRAVMVTGDHPDVAETVGVAVGVDEVLAERSPAEKVEAVAAERRWGPVIMVGDGVNDAPALAAADVGVALGARGASASSEAADVVVAIDRLDRLAEALHIARRSRRIALGSALAGMGMSAVAMVVAAAGGLAPVAGAVLQEAIDVAVILNALRALGGGRGAWAVPGGAAALTARFQGEHARLGAGIERLRAVADGLGRIGPAAALGELGEVLRFLTVELLPHEAAEERALYPVVAGMIGGDDPTGTMVRAHAEIVHLTRLLGRLVDDLGPGGPTGDDLPELRRLLYSLHAVLRLHTAQEDEAYLSLVETPAPV